MPTRTVLITGASRGIGFATAQLLSTKGYRVIGVARTPPATPFPGEFHAADLADKAATDRVLAAVNVQGRVEALVNNIGIAEVQLLDDITSEALQRQFNVNILATVAIPRLASEACEEATGAASSIFPVKPLWANPMEWMPPPGGIAMCQGDHADGHQEEGASMAQATIIGVDLAKRTFQLHGAAADGGVLFRKKLPRDQVLAFFAGHAPAVVAMETCASAHHWGREIAALGHTVKLIPPIYVKPFVKRQKNDMADAEAITEAASRPTMRFVEVKSAEQQGQGMLFRTRDLLVRQRTQSINALRGHLAEYGLVAPKGPARVELLARAMADETTTPPPLVRELAGLLLQQIAELGQKIDALEKDIRRRAPKDAQIGRLMTIPGVGAICATAVQAFCPSMSVFRSGRDFAAPSALLEQRRSLQDRIDAARHRWVGLTPRQSSTGGKARLGPTSKMGQRDIRRLLIIGASAVVSWAARKGAPEGSWLARMMVRKAHMLVVTALANKMARII